MSCLACGGASEGSGWGSSTSHQRDVPLQEPDFGGTSETRSSQPRVRAAATAAHPKWTLMAAGAVLLAAVGVSVVTLAGRSDGADAASPVVTKTVTAAPLPVQAAPASPDQDSDHEQSPSGQASVTPTPLDTADANRREYLHARRLTETTSLPFTEAVREAYDRSGAAGSSTKVRAYSSVTGRTYTMTCEAQPDATVICTGGRNARVLLW